MTDHSDLIAELRDELERLEAAAPLSARETARYLQVERHLLALSSQSLSLSEAREEIERLTTCLSKANANTEEFERRYYLESDRVEAAAVEIERLKAERDDLLKAVQYAQADLDSVEGLKELLAGIRAAPQEPSSVEVVARAIAREMHKGGDYGLDGDTAYEARPGEFRALARAAIAASPDLSSLRKGAEVAVKPLEWREVNPSCDLAETPFGSIRVYRDGTWYGQWSKEGDEQSADFEAAKSAAQSDFETRIRSALVSGSREEKVDESR